MPLSSLTTWFEQLMARCFTQDATTFDQELDAFFAPNADLRINGQPLDREGFCEMILDMKQQWVIATVDFLRTLECMDDVARGAQAGDVASMFDARGRYRESGHFATEIRVSANAAISWFPQDSREDKRRIQRLTMLYIDVPYQIAPNPSSS